MYKKLSLLIVFILVLMTRPVIAQDDPYADVDPSDQVVTFWHRHSGNEREEALNAIIADFNESNEWSITVVPSYQGSFGDIFQKMTLSLAAGDDLPNLVIAFQNQAATYQFVDGLVDMSNLVDSPTWGLTSEEKEDFFPGPYNADVFPSFGNARLGFPHNRSMTVIYYNIDWLQELAESGAISFNGPPTTPEQFREAACAAVENPFSGATGDPETSIGYQLSVDASQVASWTFAFGGDVFNYEANEYAYNSAEAVEAISFLQDLFSDGCVRGIEERFGERVNFAAGTTLFTIGTNGGLPSYSLAVEEGSNHNWSIAAIPHVTENPVQNVYGPSLSIPRSTPEQELATWLFVKYFTQPEIQARWAQATNFFPVRASAAEGLDEYFAENEEYQIAFDLLQYGIGEPPAPGYDFVRGMIEETLATIVSNPSINVQEALDNLNEEANQVLADQLSELEE